MATSSISSVLKDVVAYVDVWSSDKTANYSKPFIQQLQDMGAQVTKTFNKQVTHVIFNYGHPATWSKAKKSNVKLVSVLWVGRCHDEAVKADEDLFPALNDTNPVLKNKKHRCMQPKDSPERTPDNDKRMRKKLDKLMKDFTPQKQLVTDNSPIIIDEKNGIVYSPALKRSDYMARRLKDMKEKRENISPTASQMVESPSELKPSLGNSPTVFKFPYDQSDDDSSASVAETGLSPAKEEGTSLPDIKEHCHEHLRKDGIEKSYSEVFEKQTISPVQCLNFEGNEEMEENEQNTSRRVSRRISAKRNSTDSNKPIQLSATPDPDTFASKISNKKDKRRPAVKPLSSPSSRRSDTKGGKETTKGGKTQGLDENVKSFIAAGASLSVKRTSPILEKEQAFSKQAPIVSALVQATLPNESHRTVSCSSDDNVFEDYFSLGNLQPKTKIPVLSSLPSETFQLPFELDSDTKKRKPRRSESAVNETKKASKKKKLQEIAIHLKDLDEGDTSESSNEKNLLPNPCSSTDNLKQQTKKRRQSALPFTSICATSTKRSQRPSLSFEPTMSEETDTALELHKKSDSSFQSCSSTSRGNEDTDASGLIETVSEEQDNEVLSLQTMVHKTKVGRTLVMTSMPTEKQNTVLQVVKALGGFTVVDEVCESTTHVVSGGDRRTLNILLGIARGCWILSFEWILWSLEKRQWIPEEPYELSEQFPAAQICRLQRHLSAGEHQQDLFQDQPVMFVSHLSQPPTQSLIELIQLCGGRVCRTVRQAGLCIGKYSGRRPAGARALSEQWVLDSITHLKQLPYDGYTLD